MTPTDPETIVWHEHVQPITTEQIDAVLEADPEQLLIGRFSNNQTAYSQKVKWQKIHFGEMLFTGRTKKVGPGQHELYIWIR